MSASQAPVRQPPGTEAPDAGARNRRRRFSPQAIAWVLFDFGATIFSYVVVTRYFNDWIVIELGQPDILIGVMSIAVAAVLILALPFFGALSDRFGRHRPLLAVFSLIAIAATASLGAVDSVALALIAAGLAIFAFDCADSQYNPMLASVAAPRDQGFVSGIAVAFGYVGTIVALFVVGGIVAGGDNQSAFLPAAALYLAFVLPCILLVREHRRPRAPGAAPRLRSVPRAAMRQLAASLRSARGRPHGRLLVARFLYVDAIATVIIFMTVYARRTGDFSSADLDLLLAISTGFAMVGAVAAGVLVTRAGPKPVLLVTVVGVAVTLLAVGISGSSALLWVAGPIVGMALGSVSATDRVFMLRLVPAERRGEDFGLYGMVGKVSSGFGPFVLWGGTIYVLTDALSLTSPFSASRVAVCVLAGAALVGAALLRSLPNPRAEPVTGRAEAVRAPA